jgi:hypothetical protein
MRSNYWINWLQSGLWSPNYIKNKSQYFLDGISFLECFILIELLSEYNFYFFKYRRAVNKLYRCICNRDYILLYVIMDIPLDLWRRSKFTSLKERQHMLRCALLTIAFFSSLAIIQLVKETSPLSLFVRIKYSRLTAIVAKLCIILKPSYHASYIFTFHAGDD